MLVIASTGSNPYSRMYHLKLKNVDYFTWTEYKKLSISVLDYQIIALEIDRMYIPDISEEIFNDWVLSIISALKDLISRDQVVILFGDLSLPLKLKDGTLTSLSNLINENIQIRSGKEFLSQDVQLESECSEIKEFKDILMLHIIFNHCFDFKEGYKNYRNMFNVKSTHTSVGCAFGYANTSYVYLPALKTFGLTEKAFPQFFGPEEAFKDDSDLQRLKLEGAACHFNDDGGSKDLYQTLKVLFDVGVYFLENPIKINVSKGFSAKEEGEKLKLHFIDKKALIKVNEKEIQLPPHKNEHCLCQVMFKKKVNIPVDWVDIYLHMTGSHADDIELSKNNQRSVYDAMEAVNNRIKELLDSKVNLFTVKGKTIIRHF